MVGRPNRLCLLVALVFLGGLTPARAADDWPVPRGPSREPSPFRYDPGLWKAVPKAFLEDAPACVLYAGNTYLVEADGTIETITHDVTRLNGRKGVEKLGEYRQITFNPAFQKLTLNEARIHKADGRIVSLEPRHVQLRDVATDFQVYDHDKQLVLSFPSLEVGDVLEVKWTVRGKNPEHGGHFFTRYNFGDDTYPVVRDELRVRLPKDRPFHFATVGGQLEPERTTEGDTCLYSWKATNRDHLPQDDSLPSKEELRLTLACSTFPSWEAVAKWKQELRADCWKCTEEVRRVVKDVTKDLADPAAKARALTYWVRRKVRYVSTGERHDYTPHEPGQVLLNRFGDCKDTSQLLAVMLREACIPVALATLGALDDGQVMESVPSPWGTHAILVATIDGQDHWIDTTATLAGWDFLPRDDRNRLCYVVDDKGNLRLRRTPPVTTESNRIEQTTHVWIGSDGSSRCERLAVYHGSAALGQRDNFLEVPLGERRRLVTNELQDANSRTRLGRLALDEAALRDFDRPVTARMIFEVPNHFTGSPEHEGSLSDSKVWGRLLAFNLDYDRQVPLDLVAPFESQHRFVVHVPPAYHLDSLPQEKDITSPWGRFSVKVKEPERDGPVREVEIEFFTRLDNPRVAPADFEAFRKFHEDVAKEYRVWLTLKPVQDLDEAPLLEAVLALAPNDSGSAVVLARLYQQANRLADARRVLRRALHYRPDDAVLWELTAKAADTPAEEEAAQRELVKRFPNEPRHALALGTVLVQQGKHEQARAVLEPLARKGMPANRAQAHFQLARSCYSKNEPEPALKHLEEAAQADPESVNTVRAFELTGRIFEKLGKVKEAVGAYERALVVEPDADEVLDALVRLSIARNHTDEALAYLRRYTVVVGDEVSGLLLAADYYLRLKRYDEAFELAGRARDKTFHEKAQRILGLVYLHRGDYSQAIRHLDKAELNGEVLEGLLHSYLALGNLREAAGRLEQAAKVEKPTAALRQTCEQGRRLLDRQAALLKGLPAPTDKEAEWAQAAGYVACAEQVLAEGGPPRKAEALVNLAFAQGVEFGPAFGLRARLALGKGNLKKALADAVRAIELCPREASGFYARGRVRMERGTGGGLADLEKAADLSGKKDAEVLHALADALARAGRVEEALAAQREAVKLRPKDEEMAEQLRDLEKFAGTGEGK
jgi:tetratricopeptide (TPR) repeat protein/transglutaminase-like putative cysteine protease